MSWKPDITVAAIVADTDRFLIVEEQIRGQRVFNQPAGHVEHGESLLAAVVRETLEETAWQFEPEWLVGIYIWRSPESARSTLRFAFTGRVGGHDPSRKLDRPIIAAHWLRREQLLEPTRILRTPVVLRCIDDFLAGRRLPLSTINDGVVSS
ncbi:MAG: NUDIX hydrolase [Steroidobacteraceae bacterium]